MNPSLPKIKRDPELTKDLCKCRPFCKNRRHQFGGKLFKTSAEVLLEKKIQAECARRFPRRVYPNSPCPLLKRNKFRVTEVPKYVDRKPNVVRICQAPIDIDVMTPYIHGAILAIRTGAWDDVDACCPFCTCCKCCCCGTRIYPISDPDRETKIKDDMKEFDKRVKAECLEFRVVYNRKEL